MRSIVPMVLFCALAFAPAGLAGDGDPPRTPVLIELFTSEGCSSCPAADRQISKLVEVQPLRNVLIVALSQHVDYWNDLGWEDPFSSEVFSERQRSYAQRLETQVYTPQLVVDGADQLVGSNRDETMRAIHRASRRPKVPLELTAPVDAEGSIEIDVTVGPLPDKLSGKLVLWTAVAEDDLVVEVKRGENGGLELRHDRVTRRLEDHGGVEPGETRTLRVELDDSWNRDNLRVVTFLERRADGRIVGVAATP